MFKIIPHPGWILCRPYIKKDSLFTSIKETTGETMHSEVLAIGADLTDDNGILRNPNCQVGSIIFHKYLSEDFNIGTEKYRFVHFSDIRAVDLGEEK